MESWNGKLTENAVEKIVFYVYPDIRNVLGVLRLDFNCRLST
jgi:hypothetical protein